MRGDIISNHKEIREVTRSEVTEALKKMKNTKATGPDQIPGEAWKCLGEEGIDKLT